MDSFKIMFTLMTSLFILVGLGMVIDPKMFFYKIRSKTGKKTTEYQIQPGSTLFMRLFGLFFAVIAFFMLINGLQSPY